MNCWEILEVEPTDNQRSIKRAYAKKLKVTHPEDDASQFQALQEAFEHAIYLAQNTYFEIPEARQPQSLPVDTDSQRISEPRLVNSMDVKGEHTDRETRTENDAQQQAGLSPEATVQVPDAMLDEKESLNESSAIDERFEQEAASEFDGPELFQLIESFWDNFCALMDAPDKRRDENAWYPLLNHSALGSIDSKQQLSFRVFDALADLILSQRKVSEKEGVIPQKIRWLLADIFDWQSDELTLAEHYEPEALEHVFVALYGKDAANNPENHESRWRYLWNQVKMVMLWILIFVAMKEGLRALLK